MRKFLAPILLLVAASTFARDRSPSDYVRFLLPILTTAPGANGANWQTSLAFRNDGAQPLDAFPLRVDCFCCATCLRIRDYPALQPNQDGYGLHAGLPVSIGFWVIGRPGMFLYVERARAEQFSAHLDIADVNRTPIHATTLPIVKETEFISGRSSLPGVPFSARNRMTVRVYQLEPKSSAPIAVRIYEFGPRIEGPGIFANGKLLSQTSITFEVDPLDGCPQPVVCPAVPYHPGYAQISNLQIATDATISHSLRFEFDPGDPNEKYWPMVTVTDDTNAVQVFTVR